MPHHFFVQIGPGRGQSGLQGGDTGVGHIENIVLKNGPYGKIHRVQVWAGGRPQVFVPETTEVALAPLLGYF